MELKEYLQILKKNKGLFWKIVAVVLIIPLGYFYFQPVSYKTVLSLNVTRSGLQETTEYRYDDFYRLQADEKFCDTLVEWLKTPNVVNEIYKESKIKKPDLNLKKLAKSFSGEKRSSQIVNITFDTFSQAEAQEISANLVKILQQKTEKLNQVQQEVNWFKISDDNPITEKNIPDYKIVFIVTLLVGIFLGFWVVMLKHYLE